MEHMATFWATLSDCRRASGDDLLGLTSAWDSRLRSQSADELRLTTLNLMEAVESMATWEVFAAAWLFTEGDRDDFMLRFCEWVICHGEQAALQVSRNPDEVASLNLMTGRWHEGKLSAIARHTAESRFGESWYAKSDQILWFPVVQKLGAKIDSDRSTSEVCEDLKRLCPIRPEEFSAAFPKVWEFKEGRKVHPGLDRRTPMSYEKFWLLIEESMHCHEGDCFLRKALGILPGSQLVEFDAILDELLSQARGALKESFGHEAEEKAMQLLPLGKNAYDAVIADPSSANRLMANAEAWRGERLRKAARMAFFERTGHSVSAA